MKIKDITTKIEAFAPLSLQESYDNAGLIVGRYDDELNGGVLIAVDVTDEVVDEAIALGCGMIITHHPIVFHPMKRFNSASVVERCVERAIRHNIALYACHTNLDSTPHGMSWRLGEMLGVGNMEVLEPTEQGAGFGTIGTLAEPMAAEQFLARLKSVLGCKAVRYSKICKDTVQSVAICTGSGGSMMGAAAAKGCDIYITADLKYNDYYLPDGRFILCDVGHFESEYCAIDLLFDILADLSKIFSNFALHKSANSKNPMNYFI
jgi:dinuclear metal center YbgI/SA1388 family protein